MQYADDYLETPSTESFLLTVDTAKYPCFQVPERKRDGPAEEKVQVNFRVKMLKSKEEYQITLDENATVSQVRQAVSAQGAGAPEALRFLLKGKVLQDHKTLQEYGIKEGTLLQVMRKPSPSVDHQGMPTISSSPPSSGEDKAAEISSSRKVGQVDLGQLVQDEAFWNDVSDFVSNRLSDAETAKSLVQSWRKQTRNSSTSS